MTYTEYKIKAKGVEKTLTFACDWDVGIGGSVWTSGEILTNYLQDHQDEYASIFKNQRVIELGSGTGYVGLMTALCFEPKEVILSDLGTHVDCMQKNVDLNHSALQGCNVKVAEYAWGNESHASKLSDDGPFGIVLGTDVAYLCELYEPLIAALKQLPLTKETLVLFGINRQDTSIIFFQRLEEEGFEYYKVSDIQLRSGYRGKDFAIFKIRYQ
jgi:predicted nicotinamide N-methyase